MLQDISIKNYILLYELFQLNSKEEDEDNTIDELTYFNHFYLRVELHSNYYKL